MIVLAGVELAAQVYNTNALLIRLIPGANPLAFIFATFDSSDFLWKGVKL